DGDHAHARERAELCVVREKRVGSGVDGGREVDGIGRLEPMRRPDRRGQFRDVRGHGDELERFGAFVSARRYASASVALPLWRGPTSVSRSARDDAMPRSAPASIAAMTGSTCAKYAGCRSKT